MKYCIDCGKKKKSSNGKRCQSCANKKMMIVRWKNPSNKQINAVETWRRSGTEAAAKMPLTKKQIEARQENIKKAQKISWKQPRTEKQIEEYKKWAEASQKAHFSKVELLFSLILAHKCFSFIHQFRIENWIVDFFIFPNIIVQVDGVYWHCKKGGQLKDWYQNRELQKMGYKVIRFWDYEINNNIEKCVLAIRQALQKRLGE